MVYALTRIRPRERDIKFSKNISEKVMLLFLTQTDYLISARRRDLVLINKKKRTCR